MNVTPQAKPRMGRIEYLNVLPVYHALETGRVRNAYELVHGRPAELNAMMERGELPVSSASSIEYARRPGGYWILPDLAIGSRGAVGSVLLLSRRPIGELDGKTVLATAASHTSVALLRLLLREYARVDVTCVTGDATQRITAHNAPEAMLVIGDEALRLRKHPLYRHSWDLGEAWFAWTGLPFVFGLWVVNRATAQHAGAPARTLHAGRDWSEANRALLLDAAERRCPAMTRKELEAYFACLSYKLGDREQQGLRLFYERLAAAGEIDAAPDLAFWPGE